MCQVQFVTMGLLYFPDFFMKEIGMRKIILLLLLSLFLGNLDAQIKVETLTSAFSGSGGVKLDTLGNVYIADFGRSLDNGANGTIISIFNKKDGLKVFARGFQGASGNAFDSQGNLFQSNISGNFVSKVTPDGQVTTFTASGITCPVGVAIDKEDNLYVCNCCGTQGNTIRKVTPNGTSTLFASSSLFSCPNGITFDDEGMLYVSNFGNGRVLTIDPNGRVSTLATVPGGNNGHLTYSAAHDALFVASHGSSKIYKLTKGGQLSEIAGSGVRGNRDGDASMATFSRPNGIAMTPDGDTLYVNSSVPTTDVGGRTLNPSLLRMVTGLNSLITDIDEPEIEEEIGFSFSPNPVDEILYLNISSKDNLQGQFSIYDSTGRVLRSWDSKLLEGNQQQKVNVSELQAGSYVLKFQYQEKILSKIFMKL